MVTTWTFYREFFHVEHTVILPLLNIFCVNFLAGNCMIFEILTPVNMKMVILSF